MSMDEATIDGIEKIARAAVYDDGIGFERDRLVYYTFNHDDESKWATYLLLSRAKQHTIALVNEIRRLNSIINSSATTGAT